MGKIISLASLVGSTGAMRLSPVANPRMLAGYLNRRFLEMVREREPWDYLRESIYEVALPERQYLHGFYGAGITSRAEANSYIRNIGSNIFDMTAQQAIHLHAAGMQGYVLNPNAPWFAYTTARARMRELPGALEYLEDVDEQLLDGVGRSNFYSESVPLIVDCAATGTATFFMERSDRGDGYAFRCLPPAEVWIAEDSMRRVDTVFRVYSMTKRQCIQKFGIENLSKSMRQASSDNQLFHILHATFPRSDAEDQERGLTQRAPRSLLEMDAPYISVYMEMGNPDVPLSAPYSSLVEGSSDDTAILSTRGFWHFPYAVWRWGLYTSSPYAISPTQAILPTIYQQQFFGKLKAQSVQMHARPPWNIGPGLEGLPNLKPGGLNQHTDVQSRIEAIVSGSGNYPITIDHEERTARSVRDHYGIEYFLSVTGASGSNVSKTATEILEIQSEKSAVLSSMMGRLGDDVLEPVLRWIFYEEQAAGRMPDVPAALQEYRGTDNGRLKIVYVSPLAMAQRRIAGVIGPIRLFEAVTPIIDRDPTALDGLNTASLISDILSEGGMSPKHLYSAEQIAQRRQAAAERMQRQEQLSMFEQAARGMRNAGTDVNQLQGNPALGQQLAGLIESGE